MLNKIVVIAGLVTGVLTVSNVYAENCNGMIVEGQIGGADAKVVISDNSSISEALRKQIPNPSTLGLTKGFIKTAVVDSATLCNVQSINSVGDVTTIKLGGAALKGAVIVGATVNLNGKPQDIGEINGAISNANIEIAYIVPVVNPSWVGKIGDEPKFELDNPGYFDVGAGFTVIDKANYLDQSATGVLVTIKAYPMGRWYAPKRKPNPAQAAQTITAASSTPEVRAQALSDYLAKQTELFPVVAPVAETGSRWSIFYGHSLGNFDSTTIKASVDALGVAYDITPEFAFIAGYAFYQANLANGSFETKNKVIFGIQMNMNAFSALRNISN